MSQAWISNQRPLSTPARQHSLRDSRPLAACGTSVTVAGGHGVQLRCRPGLRLVRRPAVPAAVRHRLFLARRSMRPPPSLPPSYSLHQRLPAMAQRPAMHLPSGELFRVADVQQCAPPPPDGDDGEPGRETCLPNMLTRQQAPWLRTHIKARQRRKACTFLGTSRLSSVC